MMQKTEQIVIRCEPDEKERMQDVADHAGLTLSEWARRVLGRHVCGYEKLERALDVEEKKQG
jgi:antitoxin component of RelBE/YafQ-DinJ toxin-antitoxin module